MSFTLNFIILDSEERNSTAKRPVTGGCKRVTNDAKVLCIKILKRLYSKMPCFAIFIDFRNMLLTVQTDSYHFAC